MFVVEHIEENSPVKISNGYLTVHFGANGFAESVQVNQNTYPFSIGMFKCVKLITERYKHFYFLLPIILCNAK